MKKVSGYISVKALGCYDYEFFVDDSTTDEEIEQMVNDRIMMSSYYDVEEGYEEYTAVHYRKRG